MFYSLHRTYSNIFTIFGPAHIFLHKNKHKSISNIKEKENTPQASPLTVPTDRPNSLACQPVHASVPPLPSLSPLVADGRAPLVSSVFFLASWPVGATLPRLSPVRCLPRENLASISCSMLLRIVPLPRCTFYHSPMAPTTAMANINAGRRGNRP